MEEFITALSDLIAESGLNPVELLGCLEVAKAELIADLFTPEDECDADA